MGVVNYSGWNGYVIPKPQPPIIPRHKEEKKTDESKSGFFDSYYGFPDLS